MKLAAVFVLLFNLIIIGCSDPGPGYNVTFRVIVKNPLINQQVYITGNQPQLASWKPDSLALDRINDSTFQRTIPFQTGTDLEFKVTAGSWWQEALDRDQHLYDNFKLSVRRDTVFNVYVYDWKNTFINGKIVLDQKRFKPGRTIMAVDNFWKYHPGDNPLWAGENFNDSSWKTVGSRSGPGKDSDTGWYRFHFIADSGMWDRSLALLMDHLGASQIWYNGKFLYAFGETGLSADTFKPTQVRIWKELKIDPKSEQVIAVRYANYNRMEQEERGFSAGFVLYLSDINSTFKQVSDNVRGASYHQMAFTLVPLILFFLHIFIFAFNSRQKENLFYALCMLGFAGVTYFSFERFIATDPGRIILHYQLNGVSVPIAIFFGLMTFYELMYYRLPKRWKLYSLLFLVIAVVNFLLNRQSGLVNYVFIGIITIDIIAASISTSSGKKKLKGRMIVLSGFVILAFFIFFQILLDYNIISSLTGNNQVFVWGMIGFAVSMSLFLSYNLSQINKDLAAQLEKVKTLSEKSLEQERAAARFELERRIMETENERKTKELEEARNLQLSILPKSFPDIAHLEIAAHMRTATEVGGDYYDYHQSASDSITLTIGDATGHGMKAGILVTLIKSLFSTMAHTYFIPDFFNHCTKVIKKMNLGFLYMGMSVLKIDKYRVTASAAGMPPFLIYRKSTHSIEEVVLKGMPLGAFVDFHYQQETLKVEAGDVILLLTDGILELFNANREMIDEERVKKTFLESSKKDPSAIIETLLSMADKWLNGFQQSDDITFIVIKIK